MNKTLIVCFITHETEALELQFRVLLPELIDILVSCLLTKHLETMPSVFLSTSEGALITLAAAGLW